MNVTVKYMAQIKTAAGTGAEVVHLAQACSVRDVLRVLVERHGSALRQLLFTAEGQLQPTILLFVNDDQVQQPDQTWLGDGDRLTLLSPIAGG
jgi:molybdopterin converting factor small subunit